MFNADGRTDGQVDGNSHLSQFYERVSNCSFFLWKVHSSSSFSSKLIQPADTSSPNSVQQPRGITLLWYHGVYVTPVLFDSRFFFETVTNTYIAFYVFLCKAFLTMPHTFARFCLFPFIFFIYVYFRLWTNGPP